MNHECQRIVAMAIFKRNNRELIMSLCDYYNEIIIFILQSKLLIDFDYLHII